MAITNNPMIGKGTSIVLTNSAVTGSPCTIAKVQDIKIPTITYKDVEVTGMDSSIEDFIAGFANAGEVEIDVIYLGTQSNTIKAFAGVAGTTVAITRPNGAVCTFTGYLNSFGQEIPMKEKAMNKLKFRATSVYVDA